MATLYATAETIRKRKRIGHKEIEYEVTQPIRHAALATFPLTMTRRQKRQAIRDLQKALKRHQKLVAQAHQENLNA